MALVKLSRWRDYNKLSKQEEKREGRVKRPIVFEDILHIE